MPDAFPDGFCGGPPPPPTRSRAATGTTTGGRGSTRPAPGAPSRAATPATAGTGGPRTSPWWPTSASATTGSRSSGAASSPRRASGRRRRSTTTGAQCEALLDRGVDPVVTFHHFTTPRWLAAAGRLDDPDDGRAVRRVLRAGRRRRSATVMRRACTINEPNIVSTIGLPGRACSRRASRTSSCAATVNGVFVDAHRKAVDAIRAAAPGVPVGLTLSMTDYQAVDGGESKRDQIRLPHGGRVPRGHRGRRLRRRADLLARPGSARRARSAPRTACRRPADGLRVLAAGAGGDAAPGVGGAPAGRSPLLVTENGIGTDDDDAAHRLRAGRARRRAAGARRRHRRARLHVLVPARQLRVGVRLPAPSSASWRSTAPRSPAPPSPGARGSATSPGPTLCNRLAATGQLAAGGRRTSAYSCQLRVKPGRARCRQAEHADGGAAEVGPVWSGVGRLRRPHAVPHPRRRAGGLVAASPPTSWP